MQPVDAKPVSNSRDEGSEHRARHAAALFEAINDAVFVHDLEGHILDANPAACRRLGYTREEFLQLTTRDIDDPNFAAGFKQRVREQMAQGGLSMEGVHRAKDGHLIPVDINTSLIEIDGQPAVLAVVRDIGERKRAERRQATQYAVTRVLAEFGSLEEAGPEILREVCQGLGWDVGVLWVVDRSSRSLRCAGVWHGTDLPLTEFEVLTRQAAAAPEIGLPVRAWQSSQPAWVADVAREPSARRIRAAVEAGLRTAASFPIRSGGETRGVLEFFSREVHGPDPGLLSMMPALGNQIGQFMERQRTEREIKRVNVLLDSIVEHIPNAIFVKDAVQLRFERVNRAEEKVLGYLRDELLGKSDYDFFPKEQADFFTQKDRQVLRSKELLDIPEELVNTKDGPRCFHTTKMPILDDRGNAKYLLGISEDITERKALEETRRQYAEARERYAQELEAKNQALGESERRYRQLTEASLNAIVVADERGLITLFNPAAGRIFGYEATEIVGQSLLQLLPLDGDRARAESFRHFLENRQPPLVGRTVELRGRRKDGKAFPLELSLSAIDLGGEVQFLSAISDLTERNRMREMVIQNEKLASIGLLSAGVAHEINNPLAYVANNLVVLERDTQGLVALLDVYERARDRLAQVDPEAANEAARLAEEVDLEYVRENLARILSRTREGVQRVSKIVQSLRGLARTDRPQLEDASVPDLVDSSLEMIRGRLQRRGIQLELDFAPLPKLQCVPTQLSQVLLNLLVNALQAIEARNPPEGGRIRISARQREHEVVVEVADNGCGIDPKELPRIFDPFYTTKPVGEGTGLGLSISHGIISGHGGRIEVHSQPGQGTRFTIFLPLDPHRGHA